MAKQSVRFERGYAESIAERDSVGFAGLTDLGRFNFLVTRDALAYLINPDMDDIDSEKATDIFRV